MGIQSKVKFYSLLTILSASLWLFISMPSYSSSPSSPVKIAVIDTGVDTQHPFIRDHLWKNPGESGLDQFGKSKHNNGVDDDHNGFIDDINGWNFADQNNNLDDEDGHGTHISGLIKDVVYQQNQRIPFELINIKYFSKNSNSKLRTQAFIDALEYAVSSGVQIINISGGGPQFNAKELALLQKAEKKGILVVASAGNKKKDVENKDFYPAGYNLPNVFSVIATDQWGKILPTSNINLQRENIYAMGDQVYSSLPHNQFGKKTGSSQAAAVLTGMLVKYISEGRMIKFSDLKIAAALMNNSSQSSLFVSNSPN